MAHNVGLAQGVPEHENVIFPVRDNVLFLRVLPTGPRSRTIILAMVLGGLRPALLVAPRPPFPTHRLTAP
jgi:hypothetical protein